MADHASQSVTIAATPEQCFAVASDFEQYPQWAHDVKEATVLSRDSQGRATSVEFRTSALGRSTHYTLSYDYSQAPTVMSASPDPKQSCLRERPRWRRYALSVRSDSAGSDER